MLIPEPPDGAGGDESDAEQRSLHRHVGRYLVRWSQLSPASEPGKCLQRLGARLSLELDEQRTYLDLDELFQEGGWPTSADMLKLLQNSNLLCAAERFNAPLVYSANTGKCLYLTRYYRYERYVADAVLRLAGQSAGAADAKKHKVAEQLQQLFPEQATGSVDWQRIAAATAFDRQLTVITGGPGTGKTTTVGRLLLLLLQQLKPPQSIVLAAPTGKAAARLGHAMQETHKICQASGAYSKAVLDLLPTEAHTLHRLLGFRFIDNSFRAGPKQPLAASVVVVDEASMVGLHMMTQLLSALAPDTKLILVGDGNQIAAIEPGQPFNDLCTRHQEYRLSPPMATRLKAYTGYDLGNFRAPAASALDDCLCTLRTNHRFDSGGPIEVFANQVVLGKTDDAIGTVSKKHEALRWQQEEHNKNIVQMAADEYQKLYQQTSQGAADTKAKAACMLQACADFCLLCVTQHGAFGTVQLNKEIEAALFERGVIAKPPLYEGKLIMATANAYSIGIFNGDTGVVLQSEQGEWYGWFMGQDNEPMAIKHNQLPSYAPALALTVHKSQGSEFNRVALVLPVQPSARMENLAVREIIYTAITRARKHITIYAQRKMLEHAIDRRSKRRSGLRSLLAAGATTGATNPVAPH